MIFYYELGCGKRGELSNLIISHSQVIQNFIRICNGDNIIPLSNNFFYEESIKNTQILLNFLISREEKNKVEELLDEKNMVIVLDVLKIADFCDIEILREYLIEYFAKLVIKDNFLSF